MSAGADTARPLLAVDRQEHLLGLIRQRGTVRVADLAAELEVAAATIRRDIAALAADGRVQRVHGGAKIARTEPDGIPGTTTTVDEKPLSDVTTLGMLVPSLEYYWPGVVRGVEEAAREGGLRVVLRGSSYTVDDDRPHLARLIEQGAGALIASPATASAHVAETVEWLAGLTIPVVMMERPGLAGLSTLPLEQVHSDHAFGGAQAVKHLAALGHRRIAFVADPESPTGPSVREGWSRALDLMDVPASRRIDLTIARQDAKISAAALDLAVDAILASGSTAALVHADAHAIALVQRLEERGHSVPADLSVVAYDDEFASLFSPSLTAVRPARAAIGRAAAELVAARLADPGRPIHRVVVLPTLHVRESSAPPR